MIPPLRRRCHHCGHVDWTHRFPVATTDGQRSVVCPACGGRFEPVERPWLQ